MDSGAHSKTTWGRRKRAALPHKGGGCNMADIDDIELTPLEEANLAVAHGTFDALQEGDFERFKSFFAEGRSEEHTSELQSLMRISYAVFCLKKKTNTTLIRESNNDTY